MNSLNISKAVVLARGLGMRTRVTSVGALVNAEQPSVADSEVKAMIRIGGRPFLDYVLSGLADAGFQDICLVIGPEHGEVRNYYQGLSLNRLRIDFAIQEQALGTANALLAAEKFVAADSFLVLNSDNYYPVETLRKLRELGTPGVAAFERDALIHESNFEEARIGQYSIVETNAQGYLSRVIEKPDDKTISAHGENASIGMNCWLLRPSIFRACRKVCPSTRGELELPEAVQLAVGFYNERIRVLTFRAGVLDLSSRADIAGVAQRLETTPVNL
jgi:glucose-1-phosphate thymidylyltransferase